MAYTNALGEAATTPTMPYPSLPANGRRSDELMAYSAHDTGSAEYRAARRGRAAYWER